MREKLIVFTRYPEPGTTKTRLIPVLGKTGAANLHRLMAKRTIACALPLPKSRPRHPPPLDGQPDDRRRSLSPKTPPIIGRNSPSRRQPTTNARVVGK